MIFLETLEQMCVSVLIILDTWIALKSVLQIIVFYSNVYVLPEYGAFTNTYWCCFDLFLLKKVFKTDFRPKEKSPAPTF